MFLSTDREVKVMIVIHNKCTVHFVIRQKLLYRIGREIVDSNSNISWDQVCTTNWLIYILCGDYLLIIPTCINS